MITAQNWDNARWPNFRASEFECRHCGTLHMEEAFLDVLQAIRGEYGRPMRVTSGYRCPEHNEAVSHTGKTGPHTTGLAADIGVAGTDAYDLLKIAFARGVHGIGSNQAGDWERRFVHLDLLPRKAHWTYP